MSSSSEVRWLLFGAIGLAAVVTGYLVQPMTDAATDTSVDAAATDSPEPDSLPRETANTPIDVPTDEPTELANTPTEVPVQEPTPQAPTENVVAPPPTPPTPDAPSAPIDVYSGTHKLGVNRVTDMARVGSATFSRRNGSLYLEGRVKRGVHWLHLSGKVEPRGNDKFMLTGVIEGIPDMAWNGEAPRERRTEGSFLFEVNKRRPYWRLYQVNGRDCVCWDNCGNDFCYIDIETKPQP